MVPRFAEGYRCEDLVIGWYLQIVDCQDIGSF